MVIYLTTQHTVPNLERAHTISHELHIGCVVKCATNTIITHPNCGLKVTERIPESYLTSLATSCEQMASHHEQIMEKTRKFQIVYAVLTNLCQHSTTDLAKGMTTDERKQSALSKAGSFSHCKTTNSLFVLQVKLVSFT